MKFLPSRVALALLSLAVVGACSSKSADTVTQPKPRLAPPAWNADCDPLVPEHCGFPFPSNTALVDDPSTPTKKHVAFKTGVLPVHNEKPTDPKTWEDLDGFSPNMNLTTFFPGASVTGLPTQDDLAKSVGKDSPTVIIDATTGERVAHFSEIDLSNSKADDDEHAFILRPVVRLKAGTRYIVAVRKVVDVKGELVEPSPAFLALRSGKPYVAENPRIVASQVASIEARRPLYAEMFQKLEAAGVPRGDLQMAWDFTTASKENTTKSLVFMRDDALAKVGDKGPEYVIDKVEENPNPEIRRRILGRMTVPLYLDKATKNARIVRSPDGLPMQNGTAQFEFLVHIPHAATKGTPGALLQNGHGLLGYKTEGQNGYLAKMANKGNFVAFSVDLVGMAHEDNDALTDQIVGDIGQFRASVDRQHQGILNSLLAMRLMKGRFVDEPQVQFDGKSAIDPTRCYYRGDSQGGIFGATYMALSTDVTRGVLGEPGAPYSMLLHRSADFGPFFFLLGTVYNDNYDLALALGLAQMMWDRTEPGGYIPYIAKDMLPKTPKHDVLLHVALGDHQVTPLGAHIIARAVDAKNVIPSNRQIYGVEDKAPPFSGSAIVEWEFGTPEAPKTNVPPTKGEDPHDLVRELDAAVKQEEKFLKEGVIENFCKDKCDPE